MKRLLPPTAIAVLALAACAGEPRAPDGRYARGGASLFVQPSGASAMVFAGPISPLAYDYDAMRAGGSLGCMKEDKSGVSLSNGARLVDAGVIEVTTTRARPLRVGFDAETGAHVASSPGPLFTTGDAVTMRGAGSRDVPPFTTSAVAPPAIRLTAPAPGEAVERDADLVLAWPAADGYLDVVVKTSARTWACVFVAARGTATIERHLLADEPAGRATLRTAGIRAASVDTAGWHVSLTVASERSEIPILLR